MSASERSSSRAEDSKSDKKTGRREGGPVPFISTNVEHMLLKRTDAESIRIFMCKSDRYLRKIQFALVRSFQVVSKLRPLVLSHSSTA